MSKKSDAVKKWRKNTKQKLLYSFGYKCCVCSYDKCDSALEFHHLDPNGKDFHWGQISGNIRGWDTIVVEMEKCICVCSNCHREIHAGVTLIPAHAQRFDPTLIPLELLYHSTVYDKCPVCENQKLKARKVCSRECLYKMKIVGVDWSIHDVVKLLEEHVTYTKVGEILGITGNAVSRRHKQVLKKINNQESSSVC